MKMRRNAKNSNKAAFEAAREYLERLDLTLSARVEHFKTNGKLRQTSCSLTIGKTLTTMRYLQRFLSSSIGHLRILTSILCLMTGTICGAEEPRATTPPTVFLPHETQHGFAEFDSPPDFF